MTGVKVPNHAVVISGKPDIEELICKTYANCTPGVLVMRDTDDTHFKVCGASDKPGGWLNVSYKKGIGDTYAADEAAEILSGNFFARALTDASGNITKNDRLIADTGGKVKKANDDASLNSTFTVGYAAISKTYTGSVLAIAVKSTI
jgi:hypothetical protein